ncbi:MAG: FKBP-type peptidyl-prolyl cis-trans isomerase [Bacteroidales bacterium]
MNRKSYFSVLVIILMSLIMITMGSCKKKYPGFDKNDDGLYYTFHEENDKGESPKEGDQLTLLMRYYTLDPDSVLFNSVIDMKSAFKIEMQAPRNKTDLFSALHMMQSGDSATFIMHADSLLASRKPAFLDSLEHQEIFLDLRLVEIKNKEQMKAEQQQQEAEKRQKEQSVIEKYLKEQGMEDMQRTDNGIYFLKHKNTGSEAIEEGSVVKMTMKGELLDGTVFQETSPEFAYILGANPDYPFKWDQALLQMHKGDFATLLLPSDKALGKHGARGLVPPYSPVIIDILIVDVQDKNKYQEQQLAQARKGREESEKKLNQYLMQNNITKEPTSSGLIYITNKEGEGRKPRAGEKVLVHYKGSFLNGDVFDSSWERDRPYEMVIGEAKVIKGWLEAVPMMREGEKATIIVPWRLAYGKNGRGNIPPYANLVFDLELVEIKS